MVWPQHEPVVGPWSCDHDRQHHTPLAPCLAFKVNLLGYYTPFSFLSMDTFAYGAWTLCWI
ncbi:hypothetical protein CC1G_13629 [Coprinopsis cinerea okayama7|uniref:Uncharacterized protein n=1 Tax=Coprinopsis cinerea (strain Okayama-7 / 130 / ATCC MYA-4618 / FGSC 9003) TaxID=240176 RepID=D6RK06_COPC7|nr:hypothetical protein CC1G_13629 [Coprinopsis cinerea okayama7\|eukprot:XP_002912096.1 hypothetical protein CC1G_13629 [Coprinopsis cinerea okayama7\